MGISRATASKWVNRYKRFGELGLLDRSSSPIRQPSATPGRIVEQIERLRREHRKSASRIAVELDHAGTPVSRRTISRVLAQLGLGSPRIIGPAGEPDREPRPRTADRPGQIVLLDAVRVSRIPDHRQGRAGAGRAIIGSVFLHTAVDGYSALTYAEALPDENPATVVAFLGRAKAWFAARGITRIERVVTGSGARYRAGAFREAVIRPRTPGRHPIRGADENSCAHSEHCGQDGAGGADRTRDPRRSVTDGHLRGSPRERVGELAPKWHHEGLTFHPSAEIAWAED